MKTVFALPLAAVLALGACNDRPDPSAAVEADTVEAPAEDALAPLDDPQVAAPAPARDYSIADAPAPAAQAAPTRAATQSPEEAADAAAAAAADAQAAAAGLPETE